MKIICVARNYVRHVKELNNEVPAHPIFFMKADSSILQNNKPFFIPDFSDDIHYEAEIVVRINRLGKNIDESFAHRYYNQITLGVDLTARDIQQNCISNGLPWEISKSFDGSAILGEFIDLSDLDINHLNFDFSINGQMKQQGITSDMLFSVDKIISYVSKFVTLKIGDLVYTGTPEGVGKLNIGDKLEGRVENKVLLNTLIK